MGWCRRTLPRGIVVLSALVVAGCTSGHVRPGAPSTSPLSPARAAVRSNPAADSTSPAASSAAPSAAPATGVDANPLPGMPPILDPHNIYAADQPGDMTATARRAKPLVYVPDNVSNDVYVVDPATMRVVNRFAVGQLPQHVVPAYDGSVLWVTNDKGNSLTPIDPTTGLPGKPVPVADPYNLYFTPDGRYAVVIAEALRRLDFRDPHTMALERSVPVPMCAGVDHADYTANGRIMLLSCEFAGKGNKPGRLLEVDVAKQQVIGTIPLPAGASPQDVKLSPDGDTFYVADLHYGGVWLIDAATMQRVGFVKTGAGAHGLYASRDAKVLYVSDRDAGAVSVISFATKKVVATWRIPGGGSPDMGNVSADGKTLWLSGRFNDVVYAFDTTSGQVTQIPVGTGPHGVCVWPQPGRYSLGHTGIMR